MKLKIAIVVPLVLLALGGGVLFGIYLHQESTAQQEAQVACIASAFPAVMIERNRMSIQNLLDDLQDTKSDEAENQSHILSQKIDQKFSKLSDELEIEQSTTATLTKKEATQKFLTMIELFKKEAPDYLGDCVPLFRKIRSRCGSFQKMGPSRKSCVNRYQADIGKVLDKHVSAN